MNRVETDGLIFDCRPGTSDAKAVREVVTKRGYARRGFQPRDGERWIDIGANIGAFSVWAAATGASVLAFEPDPESAELARHNIALNGLSRYCIVVQSALTADDNYDHKEFYRNTARGNVWRNSLYKQWRGGDSITVDTAPVSDVWLPGNHIKLDAEGAEMPILERYASTPVARLVFEWSFDIDPSLDRFNRVITTLRRTYGRVQFSKIAGGHREWQASWFPPCRTIWCDGGAT